RARLEVIVSAHAIGGSGFVGQRISNYASNAPKCCPLIANRSMHLVRSCGRCPVNGSILKMVESTQPIMRAGFVRNRVAEKACFGAQQHPPIANGAVNLMNANSRGDVYCASLISAAITLAVPADLHLADR